MGVSTDPSASSTTLAIESVKLDRQKTPHGCKSSKSLIAVSCCCNVLLAAAVILLFWSGFVPFLFDHSRSACANHGMWFDGWPMLMHLPYSLRPLHMTFGDDTEFTRDELQTFVDAYDRGGIRIDWQVGDILVFCNYRFAHGRPAIKLAPGEERELGVMLGGAMKRTGQKESAWPLS